MGRILREVIEQGGDLIEQGGNLLDFWIFEKLVVHRALRVHYFGRVAHVRGKNFGLEVSALIWLRVSSFSLLFQHDCIERYLCL